MNSTPVPRIFSFHVANLGNCCIHVVVRKATALDNCSRQLLLTTAYVHERSYTFCPTTVHPWTYAHASYLCPVGTSLLLGATCTLNLDILDHNLPGPDLISGSSLSPGSVP